MKAYLFTAVISFFLFTGCNNDDSKTSTVKTGNEFLSKDSLPKGKFIISDEAIDSKLPVDNTEDTAGSLNGFHLKKKNTVIKTGNDPLNHEEYLRRQYKNLLVFHADDTMKIKKGYIATLELGKDQVLEDIKEEVLTSSNAKPYDKNVKLDTTMEIGTRMKATLKDLDGGAANDKGIEIESLNPDATEQDIDQNRKRAIWQWRITPLKPGQQELALVIQLLESNGRRVNLPTKNIQVIIFAEKQTFLSQVGDFFNDTNSKWLVTAICIPILIAWFTTRMRHSHDIKAAQARADLQKNTASPTEGNAVVQSPSKTEINKST